MNLAETGAMHTRVAQVGPPSKLLWAREVAAWPEFSAFVAAIPWWGLAARGDGHPVLVLPGLLQSDWSTRPLRAFLKARGFDAIGWRLGRNTGRSGLIDESLVDRLRSLHERDGRKVSLIGWSMGGLFARDLARRVPEAVRQLITLGSPFTGPAKASNAWRLYEALSGDRAGDPELAKRFGDPVPVPTTSIYSRRDGIVAWQCCLNDMSTRGGQVENIAVTSTHCGMGHHPAVLYAVADRLAQPDGKWSAFVPPPGARWLYPTTPDRRTTDAHHTHKTTETSP
jgi:pimeloyl-ACP methyl ester carboxylesterase